MLSPDSWKYLTRIDSDIVFFSARYDEIRKRKRHSPFCEDFEELLYLCVLLLYLCVLLLYALVEDVYLCAEHIGAVAVIVTVVDGVNVISSNNDRITHIVYSLLI